MTPDMKRLCDEVEQVLRGYEVPEDVLPADGTEAVVRAVLMKLLEGDDDENMINRIDRILAEPAKA